jgi:predicted DNA-binding protein YlxM (UPF0122 family)
MLFCPFALNVEGYKDEETLRELYHEQDLTTYEIAERFDVTQRTIHRWITKNEIETREPGARAKSRKEFLQPIKDYVEAFDEVPSQYDMEWVEAPTIPAYRYRFGSWSNAVRKAGFEPQMDNRDK